MSLGKRGKLPQIVKLVSKKLATLVGPTFRDLWCIPEIMVMHDRSYACISCVFIAICGDFRVYQRTEE